MKPIGPVLRQLFDSVRLALVDMAEAVKEGMQVEGTPVPEPVPWDTPKQQMAFFASGGFGEGIPHFRTGLYIHSFQANATPYGAQTFAPSPAGAIGGMPTTGWQSSVTRGRWPHILTVVYRELGKLPENIRKRIRVNPDLAEGPK